MFLSKRPRHAGPAAKALANAGQLGNLGWMANTQREVVQQELEQRLRSACDARDYAAAATAVLEEIGPKILAFLLHRLGNPSDAGEAFCMFSEDLWRGLPSFEWRCTLRGWCFALARHAADRLRSQAWNGARRLPLSHAPLSRLAASVRDQTLPYLRSDVKGRMRQLFEQLPVDDQALLQLRLDQALSFRDVALALEFTGRIPSDAELDRAAAKLRQRYKTVKQRLRQFADASDVLEEES
jgi:RNA polymerase sigma-70 factor (ECF subfamily)